VAGCPRAASCRRCWTEYRPLSSSRRDIPASPLAYALAVLVACLACLAIAFDRAELLFIAAPLVLRLAQSLPPADADIGSFALASDGVAPSEGDAFTLTIDARLTAATGLV
jgi:hypothetical protein